MSLSTSLLRVCTTFCRSLPIKTASDAAYLTLSSVLPGLENATAIAQARALILP